MLRRQEGGPKGALGGVCAGGRDPRGDNFMSTLELVPSMNATRLLRTAYGINTPIVAPTFHLLRYRTRILLTQEVGLLGLGRVSVASKSQQRIESPISLASRVCSFWASEFNQILRDHLLLFNH